MQRLFEFIGHHPYLAIGALLAGAAVIFYEVRERVQSFAALSAMQAVRLMNQGALIIDLRGKDSFDAGHIGDARNIPAAELETQSETLQKWRDKTVITYCDSGVSGAAAARTLTKLGFTQGLQSRRGIERLDQGQFAARQDRRGGQGKRQVSAPEIVMYSAGWCPYCDRARRLLTEKGLTFREIDVDEDAKLREEMIARSGRRTVPQIFIGTRHIGGCDELYALDGRGELDPLIEGAL